MMPSFFPIAVQGFLIKRSVYSVNTSWYNTCLHVPPPIECASLTGDFGCGAQAMSLFSLDFVTIIQRI